MFALNGFEIYGLITIGLLIGYISDMLFTPGYDTSLLKNIGFAVIGCLIIGIIARQLGLGAMFGYALVGTLGIIFLTQVFDLPQTESEPHG